MQMSKIVNESIESFIILDFKDTKFQYSSFLAGLFILCKGWEANGLTIVKININQSISNYLEVVNFHKGFIPMNENDFSYFFKKTYTPLFIFSTNPSVREFCVDTVLKIVVGQTKVTGPDCKNVIDYFISELTNNVAEHSESDCGIIFTQSYPNKGFIDITIADNGVGIYESYKKSEKFKPKDEADAIEMAINGCSTKDHSISRGFGLSVSRSLVVDGLNGKFCLWSGDSIFLHSMNVKDIIQVETGAHLKGCYINLRLPLNITLKKAFYEYLS